jgi:tetratricopeptide (TPR) repeat protein
LQTAFQSNPNSGEIAKYLAWRLNEVGRTNEAFVMAQRAFALEPENLQAVNQARNLAAQSGKDEVALEVGRAALGLAPGDPNLQFNVACSWANLRDPAAAIRQFEMLLALNPPAQTEAQAHIYLGRLLAGEPGRKAEAISHFQAALRLDPDNAECRKALGTLQ